MFEESPTSERIFDYFNRRIGQTIAPIGLLKSLAIYSAGCSFPRLALIHQGRSREHKSNTTNMVTQMFSKEMYIHIVGEQTIHRIAENYGTDLDGKCILIDDGNLLFSNLAYRTKMRWLSLVSTLLTQRKAVYGDKMNEFTLTGRVSLAINMATPSWNRHKNEIFETNLGNRAFIVHPTFTDYQRIEARKTFKETKKVKPHVFISERNNRTIKNLSEYEEELLAYAKDYAILSIRNTTECQDIIEAIVKTNARINDRNYVCDDDLRLIRMLRQYNIDPNVPDEPRVIGFLKEGRSSKDICHLLGKPLKTYKSTISYYRKKGLERGTLDYEKRAS
jgi:hypothetical protein